MVGRILFAVAFVMLAGTAVCVNDFLLMHNGANCVSTAFGGFKVNANVCYKTEHFDYTYNVTNGAAYQSYMYFSSFTQLISYTDKDCQEEAVKRQLDGTFDILFNGFPHIIRCQQVSQI
mmetsp:Transcript_10007/g.28157  ORF Transcript_10007/g.28157 Transcript_10007/m.28157 type:complete len:119 (+) Transcript_10007:108-464(+)|eukprot:CAMPEP_0119131254 /NCGR_PEP_ID=MMETSP1310-20130426/9861_1 /TAXON_ID=464262 /ORGANISM="Genus nov. species nov., Strain RCC2339" /LENGTH=118 /DNA_ID=CAMNT_0007121813 /DNA_START=74 /DNA_END=430 /DNA_ORIENTATION=+